MISCLFHHSSCSSIFSSSTLNVDRGGLSSQADARHIVEEVQHVHVDLLLELAQGDVHGAGALALAAFRAAAREMDGMDQWNIIFSLRVERWLCQWGSRVSAMHESWQTHRGQALRHA